MSAEAGDVYLCTPTTERGSKVFLSAGPKGKDFIYVRGNVVVVREAATPLKGFVYTEHPCKATAAAYAPSGNYICSGDEKGNVRIWDTTQEERKTKYEYRPLGGKISDVVWTEDSKRIVVGGDGSDTYARPFLWDSGSSCGDLAGAHIKKVNAVAMKMQRPYRVVTASEDYTVAFCHGPPFKKQAELKEAAGKYVNGVAYADDGSVFASCDAGGRVFIYDGKEGTFKGELKDGDSAHKGGVYGVSFGPTGQLMTASADKTVKIWDVAGMKLENTITIGTDLGAQQLGCLWMGEHLISVGLDGNINMLDAAGSAPKSVIQGHQSNVTALALDGAQYFAGGNDGSVCRVDQATSASTRLGNPHKTEVTDCIIDGDNLVTIGMDDNICFTPKGADALGAGTKLDSQPRCLAQAGGLVVVAASGHVFLFKGGNKVFTENISYEALACSISPNGAQVAIGGSDNKVHTYKVSGDTLVEDKVIDRKGPVLAVAYSPDGAWLASGDGNRQVIVYETGGYEAKYMRWKYHTSKITCLAWAPNSNQLASGSLDTNIFVWNMADELKRIKITAAHPVNNITALEWKDDNTLFSSGFDGCVRTFKVTSF